MSMNFFKSFRRSQPSGEKTEINELSHKRIDMKSSLPTREALDDFEIKDWPKLKLGALYEFAGYFTEVATVKSEADPAAVLMTFLTRFAAECGTNPYLMIGDTRHYARIFSVIVGNSSKARKGTSGQPVLRLFNLHEGCNGSLKSIFLDYTPARTTHGPLSSGEGIINEVRDEKKQWDSDKGYYVLKDPGIEDKRLFVYDEEFSSALSCTKREGNTLSSNIRRAWDNGTMEPLTKSTKIKTTNAHLCICTHITLMELNKKLNEIETFNGFANRFLWCCARRSKEVPFPKPIPENELRMLKKDLFKILSKIQSINEIRLDDDSKEMWIEKYPLLSKDHPGLVGTVINRAETQVLRLSMIYALLDGQSVITPSHLKAALTLWDYCKASAQFIFSGRESNPHARKILNAVISGPKSTTQIHKLFSNNVPKEKLVEALTELIASGKIEQKRIETKGRTKNLFQLSKSRI